MEFVNVEKLNGSYKGGAERRWLTACIRFIVVFLTTSSGREIASLQKKRMLRYGPLESVKGECLQGSISRVEVGLGVGLPVRQHY